MSGRVCRDASSEEGRLAVNGMSYSGRNSANANSAVIITITPEDYGDGTDPLSGVAFQRKWKKRPIRLEKGKFRWNVTETSGVQFWKQNFRSRKSYRMIRRKPGQAEWRTSRPVLRDNGQMPQGT